MTIVGELAETLSDGTLRCEACAHRCLLRPGKRGICQVRFNQDGKLRVPFGYVAALQCDPTEKKPFYHFLPGSETLTFGMLGCDFHCGYCQNWLSSQALRDASAELAPSAIRKLTPADLVAAAQRMGAAVIGSSYNEPLITSEWSQAVFRQARHAGIKCVVVSNGYATPQVLRYLHPFLDGMKIDLKSMQPRRYRELGGVLEHVLDTIKLVHELGIWLEIVTLVVPGFNDSTEELMDAARFIASVSPTIPWHLTAFHPDYRMRDRERTAVDTLIKAAEIGEEAGLQFVYAGNASGRVGGYEHTHCPTCSTQLISRLGFRILENRLTAAGSCPQCAQAIPGIWASPGSGDPLTSGGTLRRPRVFD